jgi:hypothetical protein
MRSLKEEKVEAVLRIVEDKLMYSGMVFTSTGKLIYETSDSFFRELPLLDKLHFHL